MKLLAMLFDLTGSEKYKMATSQTGSTYISACRQDRNNIPIFARSSYPMNLTGSEKYKMATSQTGSTYISACRQDKNNIPIFARSSYPMNDYQE